MDTRLFVLKEFKNTGHILGLDEGMIQEAAGVISAGGLVVFPTETVYGLGGDALNRESALKIYHAKGRPSDNPLIVHISDLASLGDLVCAISDTARTLMDSFWPGPMTLIFKKSSLIPYETTGGLDTVAIRFPVHPVARMLIDMAGVPIAAPSANLSGHPSTTTAEHCVDDLWGRVDVILDGGACEIGLESSIIDVSGVSPVILRPGAITMEDLATQLKKPVGVDPAISGSVSKDVRPKAPGMKYRHYAPRANMVLVCSKHEKSDETSDASIEKVAGEIFALLEEVRLRFSRIAVLCSAECLSKIDAQVRELNHKMAGQKGSHIILKNMGSVTEPYRIAHDIFADLRDCDRQGVDLIIAEGYPEEGLFVAVMNRLKKAASWQIIEV